MKHSRLETAGKPQFLSLKKKALFLSIETIALTWDYYWNGCLTNFSIATGNISSVRHTAPCFASKMAFVFLGHAQENP